MIDQAEALLLATGCLETPRAVHIMAARSIERELTEAVLGALERDAPGLLYVNNLPTKYFDKLVSFRPDYGEVIEYLESRVGAETAAKYQVLQLNAKAVLERRHPATTIDTVLGPVVIPNDALTEQQYLLEACVVEDYMRIGHDLAAGALLDEQVAVFRECFPDTYAMLSDALRDGLIKARAKDEEWLPSQWLADTLRAFWQLPFNAAIDVGAPGPVEAPRPSGKALDLKPNELKTAAQLVG